MQTARRQRFVVATTGWFLAVALLLVLLDSLTLELFFVLSLIGFLIAMELTAPVGVTPRWRRRLRWLLVPALVVFAYLVVRRILAILPPGVV